MKIKLLKCKIQLQEDAFNIFQHEIQKIQSFMTETLQSFQDQLFKHVFYPLQKMMVSF